MGKADVENLLEWKKRRGESSVSFSLIYDLRDLAALWDEKASGSRDFVDFMPMRIVTIIEVFVREIIRELVDYGSPYLEKAEALARGAKLDFNLLASLQGRKISIGDLVAHTVAINEPGRIVGYFKELIPGFVDNLRVSHSRWIEDREEWPLKPIISDYDLMMSRLSRLFTVRHIVTHERPCDPAFDPEEIAGFLSAAGEFIEATNWVLVKILNDAVPRTQAEMNIQTAGSVGALEEEMVALIAAIKARGDVDAKLLDESQDAWEAFANKEADLHASLVSGGTMYPTVWGGAKEEEIRRRMESLRWWVDREEYDL